MGYRSDVVVLLVFKQKHSLKELYRHMLSAVIRQVEKRPVPLENYENSLSEQLGGVRLFQELFMEYPSSVKKFDVKKHKTTYRVVKTRISNVKWYDNCRRLCLDLHEGLLDQLPGHYFGMRILCIGEDLDDITEDTTMKEGEEQGYAEDILVSSASICSSFEFCSGFKEVTEGQRRISNEPFYRSLPSSWKKHVKETDVGKIFCSSLNCLYKQELNVGSFSGKLYLLGSGEEGGGGPRLILWDKEDRRPISMSPDFVELLVQKGCKLDEEFLQKFSALSI